MPNVSTLVFALLIVLVLPVGASSSESGSLPNGELQGIYPTLGSNLTTTCFGPIVEPNGMRGESQFGPIVEPNGFRCRMSSLSIGDIAFGPIVEPNGWRVDAQFGPIVEPNGWQADVQFGPLATPNGWRADVEFGPVATPNG